MEKISDNRSEARSPQVEKSPRQERDDLKSMRHQKTSENHTYLGIMFENVNSTDLTGLISNPGSTT